MQNRDGIPVWGSGLFILLGDEGQLVARVQFV